jgi:predicted nucleic acid-binding protein
VKVVCDSSALIALARIDALNLFQRQFGQLMIPDAVYGELARGKDKPGIEELTQARWIQRYAVKDRTLVGQLHENLHLGESEVIVLAGEIGADLVIMDDARARQIAEAMGIKVVGVLAVLLDAKRKGLIVQVRPLLEALREKGFFIEDELYALLLQKAGE